MPPFNHEGGTLTFTPSEAGTHVDWLTNYTHPLRTGGKFMEAVTRPCCARVSLRSLRLARRNSKPDGLAAGRRPGEVGGLVVGGWGLWLEGLVPPPVGAFAGGPWAGWDGGRGRLGGRASDPARSRRPVLSVTTRALTGPVMVITPRWCSRWWYGQTSTRLANSVAPPSSQWTMWWACSRGCPTAGNRARGVAVLEGAAQPRPTTRVARPAPRGCPWR
ncbi:hypothetical protein I553_7980 [Mycobacterium xenopi 4042]|uniref:Uncharacterized protein n=1 Tax=Mycobacterium xenopi 4042 TaxID=1299334 RepID=X8DCX6_MYCXE|nr:hypothetical protein I553_7980 [Mycobacterium xenopi 4042]